MNIRRFPNSHSGWKYQNGKIVSYSRTSDCFFDIAKIVDFASTKRLLRFAQLGQDIIGLLDCRAIRQAMELGVGGDYDPNLVMTDAELMDELNIMVSECLNDISGRLSWEIRCPGDLTSSEE